MLEAVAGVRARARWNVAVRLHAGRNAADKVGQRDARKGHGDPSGFPHERSPGGLGHHRAL